MRSMVTPKSFLALVEPNPRAIADDVWAKLIWAVLDLTADDLPKKSIFGGLQFHQPHTIG